MNILVTGANGFVGKNLCAALVVYAPTTGSLLIDDFRIYRQLLIIIKLTF